MNIFDASIVALENAENSHFLTAKESKYITHTTKMLPFHGRSSTSTVLRITKND